MKAKFYVSETGHDVDSNWFPLKAKTEIGAKREVTREHCGGYNHHTMQLGEIVIQPGGGVLAVQRIASKPMRGEWSNVA